jgi:hypothetical protein
MKGRTPGYDLEYHAGLSKDYVCASDADSDGRAGVSINGAILRANDMVLVTRGKLAGWWGSIFKIKGDIITFLRCGVAEQQLVCMHISRYSVALIITTC